MAEDIPSLNGLSWYELRLFMVQGRFQFLLELVRKSLLDINVNAGKTSPL
jgi:hypothetical protein